MRLYQNTKYSIGVTTEKKSKVYGAIILNETASSDTYPYWDSDDSKLSTNWRQLSSTTQNTAHNNLYYVTIETMWPKLSFSKSVSSYGVSYGGGYHTGTHSLSAGAVGSYDNQCERKNYTNKCWPLRMYNGLIHLENVYQGDKKAYSYKNESGASVYLDKYKLNGGVPFAATEVDWQFRWKPKFVNNTTLATTTCTPEFSYGPFNDSSSTVVTDVTYNAASGEYSFKTPKNGLIFVRWPNGVALDVASSQNITVIRPE